MAGEIMIVGVGALGSHVALLLRNMAARKGLKICDFDKVESKNVASQFHSRLGLGRNKAQTMQQTLMGLFGLRSEAIPHMLTDANADVLLKGASVVVDCTDNAAARRTIMASVRRLDVPCVHCAMSDAGDLARIVWTDMFAPDEETPGKATCEDGANLPFHACAGAIAAGIVQRFLMTGQRVSVQATPLGIVRLA